MKRMASFLLVLSTLLLLPDVGSTQVRLCSLRLVARLPLVVCTTEMIPNAEALEGTAGLIDILAQAGINTDALTETLQGHRIHAEGVQAGSVLIDESTGQAAIFLPGETIRYNRGRNLKIVIGNDNFTHAVFKADTISALVNAASFGASTFFDPGPTRYNEHASNAIHELLHAMVFRSRCFEGAIADEEELVEAPNLESDIADRVQIFMLSQTGGNQSLALKLYDDLASRIETKLELNLRWRNCYELLGLPGPRPSQDILSLFGPDDTYDTNRSADACAGTGCGPGGGNAFVAVAFTSDVPFDFASVEVALSQLHGIPNLPPGPNSVRISLANNCSNCPFRIGDVIESFDVNDAMGEFGAVNPPVLVNSILNPRLAANTFYWLIVTVPGSNGRVNWHINSVNASEPFHASQGTNLNPIPGLVPPAFRVRGTPVPPPGLAASSP